MPFDARLCQSVLLLYYQEPDWPPVHAGSTQGWIALFFCVSARTAGPLDADFSLGSERAWQGRGRHQSFPRTARQGGWGKERSRNDQASPRDFANAGALVISLRILPPPALSIPLAVMRGRQPSPAVSNAIATGERTCAPAFLRDSERMAPPGPYRCLSHMPSDACPSRGYDSVKAAALCRERHAYIFGAARGLLP